MKIRSVLAGIAALFCSGAFAAPYEVSVTIEGLDGGEREWALMQPVPRDGVKAVQRFKVSGSVITFNGDINYPTLVTLRTWGGETLVLPMMVAPGKTEIRTTRKAMQELRAAGLFKPVEMTITGASQKASGELISFWQQPALQKILEEDGKNAAEFRIAFEAKDDERVAKVRSEGAKIRTGLEKQIMAYVQANPTSYVSLWYSLQHLHLFGSSKPDIEWMAQYFPYLDGPLKRTAEYAGMAVKYRAESAYKIGDLAPDFTLPDPDGKSVSLSDFRGKVLLIDTWASWCTWCRAENPNMEKMYEKYRKDGFEILAVSVDEDLDDWRDAMEEDNSPWPQVVDDRGIDGSEMMADFQVNALPFIFLVDRKGKLIAKDIRGPDVTEEGKKSINDHLKDIFGY